MRLINNIKNKLSSEIILILNPNPKAYVTLDFFPKKKKKKSDPWTLVCCFDF